MICKWTNYLEVRCIWGGRNCKIDTCWLLWLTIADWYSYVVIYIVSYCATSWDSVLPSSPSRYIFVRGLVHSDIFPCLGLLGGLLLQSLSFFISCILLCYITSLCFFSTTWLMLWVLWTRHYLRANVSKNQVISGRCVGEVHGFFSFFVMCRY